MKRTCYSIRPYGEGVYPGTIGPSNYLMEEGYIFVYQDVRGRYMSEGTFDNMRPHLPGNDINNKEDIDESSDTFDTIEWLLKNVNNITAKLVSGGFPILVFIRRRRWQKRILPWRLLHLRHRLLIFILTTFIIWAHLFKAIYPYFRSLEFKRIR